MEPKKKKKSEAEGAAAAEEKREEEKEKIPSLRLRPIDWDILVLRQDQVNDRAEGVCLWDQDDRAQQAADLLDGECDVKCVMVTSGPLEGTTNPSVKFDCKLLNAQGRLTRRIMHYTNIGNTKAKPGWVKSDGAKAPQVPIVNSTTKVMVQVSKEFCAKKDWETGKGNPGALFRDIYARWQVTNFIVHTFRPRRKELTDVSTWSKTY